MQGKSGKDAEVVCLHLRHVRFKARRVPLDRSKNIDQKPFKEYTQYQAAYHERLTVLRMIMGHRFITTYYQPCELVDVASALRYIELALLQGSNCTC